MSHSIQSAVSTAKQQFLSIVGMINVDWEVHLRYYIIFKKRINLADPKTYSEVVISHMQSEAAAEWTKYTDKYAVREYVKNTIGEQYLKKY